MTLSHKDLNAIQSLLLPIERRLSSLEKQVSDHFYMTNGQFDALFKSNETLLQEQLEASRQMNRFEQRLSKLDG